MGAGAFGTGPQRQQLAEELKRLRLAAGLTGYQLAERLGIDQSSVSRIENGHTKASIQQVDAWCRASDTSEGRRLKLLALAEEVLVGPSSWREVGEPGSTTFQRETAEIEAKAATLCVYQPAVIPGLLQTAAYARRIFESDPEAEPSEMAEWLMGRVERQRILYDDRKHLRFVIPEAVLRWPMGSVDEQSEQLAFLSTIVGRPNIQLGIIPLAPSKPTPVWRFSGFVIFDDMGGDEEPFVHLELLTGPLNIDRADQVEEYRQVFARLQSAAVFDDEARALLDRIAKDFRQGA